MSTYYKFVCKKHNKSGGFLSHQAWGLGTFDIIESFKFLGLHKDCEPTLYCEQTTEYEETPEEDVDKFIEETRGMMPHSDDWELVQAGWQDAEKKWEESMKKRIY